MTPSFRGEGRGPVSEVVLDPGLRRGTGATMQIKDKK
jgi:hypothetical protein